LYFHSFVAIFFELKFGAALYRPANILGATNDPRGPFLEGPEKFPHPESRSKISNLMITELFYLHILNMARNSLHSRSFRRTHLSVIRYRLTINGFAGPKSFRGFRKSER